MPIYVKVLLTLGILMVSTCFIGAFNSDNNMIIQVVKISLGVEATIAVICMITAIWRIK